MRIGLDFDNTLACYEDLFPAIALRNGMLENDFSGGKRQVRDAIRKLPNGEQTWMMLQGQVYGRHMAAAQMFDGVASFLRTCHQNNCRIFIVSHKTQFGHYDEQHVDLRKAAISWMVQHKFFDPGYFAINQNDVFFSSTRDKKIDRIRDLDLDVYIDDLEEVLSDQNFPTTVRKIQFDPTEESDNTSRWSHFTQWLDICFDLFPKQDRLLETPEIIAKLLCNNEKVTIQAGGAGGNNTLWKVNGTSSPRALKVYESNPLDPRNRLSTEKEALLFLEHSGETQVPKFISQATDASLLSWVDGAPIDTVSDDDIIQTVHFITRLQKYSHNPKASDLPLASESCLSGRELCNQVENRFAALNRIACLHPELETFLTQSLMPVVCEAIKSCEKDLLIPIGENDRILSPSDFGFHNALRQSDGKLVFLDFEYFGWDDPVKLVADFLLHPAMSLNSKHKQFFLDTIGPIFRSDPSFSKRLQGLYLLYVLRWCAIMLNPFVPHLTTATRTNNSQHLSDLRTARLEKAKKFFQDNDTKNRSFPYDI